MAHQAVIGEALIDLVLSASPPDAADHGSAVAARPGGGPFNTARTLARLGQRVTFLGGLADDGFGRGLRASLDRDGVLVGVAPLSDVPTTLAVAEVDGGGAARYRFYLSGTSAALLDGPTLAAALPADVTMVHAGAVALAMEPIASAIEQVITTWLDPSVLVMIDPNCRPAAITDRAGYLARLWRILSRTDVVKVSTEDLSYLFPGVAVQRAVSDVLSVGPRLVLVTDGPRPAQAVSASWEVGESVPVVRVADTIGAGDAFDGAFLAWWARGGYDRSSLGEPSVVRDALRFAVEVAALTCTRVGAEPPLLSDLPDPPALADPAV
ncbi:MAG TPA: carbohydrate kinase, partial [Streptosporangiaceae bacterium]|nr:carbohydrate kinase [Streptosporangiaceae bacterium]